MAILSGELKAHFAADGHSLLLLIKTAIARVGLAADDEVTPHSPKSSLINAKRVGARHNVWVGFNAAN